MNCPKCDAGRMSISHPADTDLVIHTCDECGWIVDEQDERDEPSDHTLYTTADRSYDGFGTRHIRTIGKSYFRNTIRQVKIEDEHFDWQITRYGSGMGLIWEEADLVTAAELEFVILKDAVKKEKGVTS